MNKKIIISAAAMFLFVACSDDKSVETTVGATPSSEDVSGNNVVAETLTDADKAFMNNLLPVGSSGPAISDNIDLDEAVPTAGGTLNASPVALNPFKTEPEYAFSSLKSTGSCGVNVYKEENGIYYFKTLRGDNPGEDSDGASVTLVENDGKIYKLETHFKRYSENAVERCKSDSAAFVSECDKNDGIHKIYNNGCSAGSFEVACVSNVPNETTIEAIASGLKTMCEEYVTTLPEASEIPSEQCVGDSEHGLVCEKI